MKNLKELTIEMKHYMLFSALLMVFVLSGCNDFTQNPAATDLSVNEVEKSVFQGNVKLPISGTCETTFDPPTFLRPPSVFSQTDIGTCVLSHLGKSDFYSVKEINFATSTQVTTEAIFTAANGDQLYATGEGVSSPGDPGIINFNATLIFEGGTGRFKNATGSIHVEGQADVINRVASIVMKDGLIHYKALDRRNK